MLRGRVAMVGTGCAKKFKRAKRSDLASSFINQPTRLTEQEFHTKFASKRGGAKLAFGGTHNIVEFHAFKGYGLVVTTATSRHGTLPSYPYDGYIAIIVYDPYIGHVIEDVFLLYKRNALGEIVEQRASKSDPGYSQIVQDFLDANPKWDPIALYVPGSAHAAQVAKSSVKIAQFLSKVVSSKGDARLYRMDPPFLGNDYVVVSALPASSFGSRQSPETFIFASDANGLITDYVQLTGSFIGDMDHAKALKNAGYTIAP
jgi:hypothetical protein